MMLFEIPLHKLIIHFPIALAIMALVYDSWAIYAKKPELHKMAYGLTLWASVGALAAVATGLQLSEMIRIDKGAATGHAGFAIGATVALAGLAAARYSAQAQERKEFQIWWIALEVGAVVLIIVTAILGHRL